MSSIISILIPSLREEAINRTIREFYQTNSNIDYELIILIRFEVRGDRVKWIKEINKVGSVSATNEAYKNSEGKYVVYFNDHVSPTYRCLTNMIDQMNFSRTPYIGAFKMVNQVGREIGPFGVYDKLYGCYGCMSRDTVNMLGGLPFNSDFKFSWADCDISLRCWEAGGSVEIIEQAVVMPYNMQDEVYKEHRKTFDQDFETFANKWHQKLGAGLSREVGVISHKLCNV